MDRINNLKIIAVNANSIITNERRFNLLQFANKHNPDLILLSETKLNSNHKITFQDYTLHRQDRINATQGGGTAVLIKDSIPHRRLHTSASDNHTALESLALEIKCNNDTRLIVVSIYAPGHNNPSFLTDLTKLLTEINYTDQRNHFILAGDFNARHTNFGDCAINTRGALLSTWITNQANIFRCKLLTPAAPTFPRAGSFLDLCIADCRLAFPRLINNKLPISRYDSDHKAIILNVILPAEVHCIPPVLSPNIKIYKKTNWKKFNKTLTSKYTDVFPDDRNLSNAEIDRSIAYLTKIINETIEDTVPRPKKCDSMVKYVNRKIASLHKKKSFILTQIKNCKRGNHQWMAESVASLQLTLNSVNAAIKKEFAIASKVYWANAAKEVNHRVTEDFFPKLNRLFRPHEHKFTNIITVADNKANIINRANLNASNSSNHNNAISTSDPATMLNVIGAHFELVNKAKDPPRNINRLHDLIYKETDILIHDIDLRTTNHQTVTTFSTDNKALQPTQPAEANSAFYTNVLTTYNTLKSLKNKTSSGIDKIPNVVLKRLPMTIIKAYTTIFNNCLNNLYYPVIWKTAKILPIVKKDKDETDPNSYRPISLLPNISKAFEMFINNCLANHAYSNNIIPNNQFGFRHRHSTVHAINCLTTDLFRHLNNNKLIGAGLIDLEKAFDSVWLRGLFYKLIKKGFNRLLIMFLWQMLHDRSFIVIQGEHASTITFDTEEGLQQGTVNSPLLFNIYNSDVLNLFELNTNNDTHSIAYADDLIIYVAGKSPDTIASKLEALVNNVNNYYTQWGLKMNPSKCETILIRRPLHFYSRASKSNWRNFHINLTSNDIVTPIPHKRVVKYLGILIDDLIRLNSSVDTQLAKARKAWAANSRLFYSRHLTSAAKKICYMLLIRPIITYAAPIWANCGAHRMERLRIFERQCLRHCVRNHRSAHSNFQHFTSNRKLYELANIPRIDSFIINITRRYLASAHKLENPIVDNNLAIDAAYANKCLHTGYAPTEAFMEIDRRGLWQNSNNVPILYHAPRHQCNKKIDHSPFIKPADKNNFKYSPALPPCDFLDGSRLNSNNYWCSR